MHARETHLRILLLIVRDGQRALMDDVKFSRLRLGHHKNVQTCLIFLLC